MTAETTMPLDLQQAIDRHVHEREANRTTVYSCTGFRPIKEGHEHIEHNRRGEIDNYCVIESAKDAAWLFANRWAKREFGKRGYCHHVRQDCYTTDGRQINYEAFIGVPAQGGGTSGKNVWLTVYIEDAV